MAANGADLAAENERLRAELERREARGRGWDKARRILTPVAVVLTCLALLASVIGVWVNRTIWDDEKYAERIVPIIEQPAVVEALATQLTDQVMVALDVETRVRDALTQLAANLEIPSQVAFLAGPLTESIHDLVYDQTVKFLSSETFKTYWSEAQALLHPKIVALLNGDYDQLPNITVGEEVVQLDLLPVIAQILQDLAQEGVNGLNLDITVPDIASGDPRAALETLSRAVGQPLPPDFGQITIMTTAELQEYQTTARALRATAWILVFLTLLFLALSLALSKNRRRTVAWLGIGVAATMVLATVVLRNIVRSIVDSIDGDQARAAAQAIVSDLGSSLRGVGAMVAWIGVAVAVVAYLLGRPRWLLFVIAWVRSAGDDMRGSGGLKARVAQGPEIWRLLSIALAVIVLFITGINLVSVVVVGVLLALALWWIWQAASEPA